MKELIGPRRANAPLRADITLGETATTIRLLEKGVAVLNGPWTIHLSFDDSLIDGRGNWKNVCRFADRDAHHREYERRLAGGMRHQRQVTICPRDGVALLADTVLARRRGRWQIEIAVEFSPNVRLAPMMETCELRFAVEHLRGLLIPLAFPEWRQDRRVEGSITISEQRVTFALNVVGQAVFFPLFFAFWARDTVHGTPQNDGQFTSEFPPYTWRHLTVSECLNRVANDQAVGFRVQIGDRQWVLYRSLTPPANRAVLGKNLISESLLGRFKPDGTISPLVEVELDDDDDQGESSG